MSHKKLQQNISRLMALLLVFALVLCATPAVRAEGESGSCGSNLTWSLNGGTLVITGSGAMTDFPESTMAPWYPYREEILRLELPSGLTSIGNLAFYECKYLTAVVIPSSVATIGDYAFTKCEQMQILSLGSGVKHIGEAAFSDCYSITSLELPNGLVSIGTKGFYRCESITSIDVPGSVTSMGVSVFAYCANLITANVNAAIRNLPEYTFYGCERLASVKLPDATENISDFSFRGCDQLDTVYYGGSDRDPEEIHSYIGSDVPGFASNGTVSVETSVGTVTSGTIYANQDGTLTQDQITVIPGENASVSSKVEYVNHPDGTKVETNAEITVSINGSAGWDEAKDIVGSEIENALEKTENVSVNVYVKDTDQVSSDFVNSMAGKPANVTITTENGSVWKVDASQMDQTKTSGEYDLSYTLIPGSADLSSELGAVGSYELHFVSSAEVNSEVLIRVGNSWAFQNAALFQRTKTGLERVQTVVVDRDGYAHFYLAAVNKDTDYCIGLNIQLAEDDAAPVVPEVLQMEYGNVVDYEPIQYEITGRTSSWGIGLGQVMGILAVVMISVIVIVGVVMFLWNKKRLKDGYIPQWDDEDE